MGSRLPKELLSLKPVRPAAFRGPGFPRWTNVVNACPASPEATLSLVVFLPSVRLKLE